MKQISKQELHKKLSQVKLLALDVDGVLTDGGLYYTEAGEELKKFNVKDGMGIKLLLQGGIEVALITTSVSSSVQYRARKLGIPHVFLGAEDKLSVLKELCEQLKVELEQVAYVGDDINDVPVMEEVGCPLTVADAMEGNLACAIYISSRVGGSGAVREICELIIATQGPDSHYV